MKLQRFQVSNTPHLTVKCYGDLDIAGGREGEVAIKAYGDDEDLKIEREGESFTISSRARCKIGCPKGSSITVDSVHGGLRVRGVDGPIAVDQALGNTVLKDVGPTTLTTVRGNVRAKMIRGDFRLNQVTGNLTVRGVDGLLVSQDTSGNLTALHLTGGLNATVSGNATLTTDLSPGCTYSLTANGNTTLKLPTDANAHFQIEAAGSIQHKNISWDEIKQERNKLDGRIGSGQANVTVQAGGKVTLRGQDDSDAFVFQFVMDDDELGLEIESMSEELERNIEAHMARMNAHLEAKLSHIDHEAIRRKAEQAAEKTRVKAERAAERARLRADRAQRRWERLGARRPTPPTPPTPSAHRARPADPVTEPERLMVLRMVQEGKISVDEAAQLLQAMEG